MEKEKEITEDERFRLQETLETIVKIWNDKIRDISAEEVAKITNGNWLRLYRDVFGAADQVTASRLPRTAMPPVIGAC